MEDGGFQFLPVLDRYGVSIALVVYFLVKDWKFSRSVIELIGRVEKVLDKLENKL